MKKIKICLITVLLLIAIFSCKKPVTNPGNLNNKVIVGGVYVTTFQDIVKIASNVNSGIDDYKDKVIVMSNDIDFQNQNFISIGNNINKFNGTFDGNGYTVKNLNINNTTLQNGVYIGFIGVLGDGAAVKNLTIEGSIRGYSAVGGIVGVMTGNSKIENSTNKASVYSLSQETGGIVGYVYCQNDEIPKIINCENQGTVNGLHFVGGIAGYVLKSAEIINSKNIADIMSSSGSAQGGIAGSVKQNSVTVINAVNTGKVNGVAASDANRFGEEI